MLLLPPRQACNTERYHSIVSTLAAPTCQDGHHAVHDVARCMGGSPRDDGVQRLSSGAAGPPRRRCLLLSRPPRAGRARDHAGNQNPNPTLTLTQTLTSWSIIQSRSRSQSPNPDPNQVRRTPAGLRLRRRLPNRGVVHALLRCCRYRLDRSTSHHLRTPYIYICAWVVKDPASRNRVACKSCSA